MKTLDASLQIRCEKSLKDRLKKLAVVKRTKYQRLAREELEKYVQQEETRGALKRKVA